MAITEKQRHELIKRAEEVFGEDHAETLMDLLPPVGWADVATKQDLALLSAEIRADLHKELSRLQLTFLTAVTVLLAVSTAVERLLA